MTFEEHQQAIKVAFENAMKDDGMLPLMGWLRSVTDMISECFPEHLLPDDFLLGSLDFGRCLATVTPWAGWHTMTQTEAQKELEYRISLAD